MNNSIYVFYWSHWGPQRKCTLIVKQPLRWEKGHWPLDDLWPHICWGHMCDSTQGSLCPSPMKIHQSMWIWWPFLQKPEPKVTDPRWPLTPHLLRSHVWPYPRIIVSKPHGNTSMYVDTVINFANYHIHTTYYIHTYYIQNEWSHSLFLNTVQARQKMKSCLKTPSHWDKITLFWKEKKENLETCPVDRKKNIW